MIQFVLEHRCNSERKGADFVNSRLQIGSSQLSSANEVINYLTVNGLITWLTTPVHELIENMQQTPKPKIK